MRNNTGQWNSSRAACSLTSGAKALSFLFTPHSTVAPGEKAGLSNKTYGYCHLVLKGLKCPYKECIHDGVDNKADSASTAMDETVV